MPKIISKYQCELCGAIYADEEAASICEMTHVHAKSIDSEEYNTYNSIPNRVYIKMSDGSVVEYSLVIGVGKL